DLAHPLLSFLLFFQQLSLTGNITAVTLGKYIFPQRLYCLSGNDLASDCRLNRNLKKLSWDFFFQLFAHLSASVIGRTGEHNKGQCVYFFFIHQNVQLHQVALLISKHLIVKGRIASGTGFQSVKKVVDDFIKRQEIEEHTSELQSRFDLVCRLLLEKKKRYTNN